MINKFKVSFIWTKALPEIFEYENKIEDRYVYSDSLSLSEVIENINLNKEGQCDYYYPWEKLRQNNFWKKYINCENQGSLKARMLWNNFVPLFYKVKTDITFHSDKYGTMNVTKEIYLYHHGFCIVVNVHIPSRKSNYDFEDIEEITRELYHSEGYKMSFNGKEFYNNCSLEKLSRRLANELKKEIIGSACTIDLTDKPFTVITVLEGKRWDIDNMQLMSSIDNIFQSMHQSFREMVPISEDCDTADIFCKNTLFSSKKGRIIWYPKLFLNSNNFKKSLGCYHKNIVRLSMHIESLSDILKSYISSDEPSDTLYNYVADVQNQLTKVYSAENPYKRKTYYSASAVIQINQNDYLGLINLVKNRNRINRKLETIQAKDITMRNSVIKY